MSRPDPNPETGGRPLAEILREAGIDMSRSARRRRWNDPEWDEPVPQRRSAPDTDEGTSPNLRRRRSDLEPPETPGRGLRAARPAEPSTAAIPGLRPSQKPNVPTPHVSAPVPVLPPEPTPASVPAPSAAQTGRTRVREPEPAVSARGARVAPRPPRFEEGPSTGPIPIAAADLDQDEEIGGRESALAWLRFGGELLIALAVGVGVYFGFIVLWEMLPYAAVLAAPIVVAGLVAGVGVWRSRLGREQMGVRMLGVLVFAGTLLAIAPAASLLSGR